MVLPPQLSEHIGEDQQDDDSPNDYQGYVPTGNLKYVNCVELHSDAVEFSRCLDEDDDALGVQLWVLWAVKGTVHLCLFETEEEPLDFVLFTVENLFTVKNLSSIWNLLSIWNLFNSLRHSLLNMNLDEVESLVGLYFVLI